MNDDMEIDPVDDGPLGPLPPPPDAAHAHPATSTALRVVTTAASSNSRTSPTTITTISREEEAKQAIEQLRGADVALRIASASKLDQVAATLGPERTRNELIPFLRDTVDDEDQVLLALASSLGRMLPHMGDDASCYHLLLPCLELLLSVEEVAVREAAAQSARVVANALPRGDYQKVYADDMLGRLAQQEWFTSRISSIGLLVDAYTELRPDQREAHLGLFARLATDETPMVRRVAANHMGTMVRNVVKMAGRVSLKETGSVITMLLPLLEEFASNEQPDSVRLQTTENCVAFGQVLSDIVDNNNNTADSGNDSDGNEAGVLNESERALLQRVLPLVVATIDDRSWRVRWTAAAKFADVIHAYGRLPNAMDSLVPAYEKLLQDPEAEVRTAATLNLAHVARTNVLIAPSPSSPSNSSTAAQAAASTAAAAGTTRDDAAAAASAMETEQPTGPRISVAERLVRRVTSLTEDDSEHVRSALARVATELATILGREGTITFLVPPILLLLRDAASEVRLNLISSLGALDQVIGVDLLSQSLLPAILDLAQDGKWRIRLAIIQNIPLLAGQLGQEFVTERLVPLCVGWLADDIATIRLAAAANLQELTKLFGTNWALEHLIPALDEIRQGDSYLRRLTALRAYAMMTTSMEPEAARVHGLPLVLDMMADPVPNVRFNVAKELEAVAPVCGSTAYQTQVLPVLNMLRQDDDRDVRFYAEQTIKALDDDFANNMMDQQQTE